jgi:hypothetical protein
LVEGLARGKYANQNGDKCANDESKANVDADAVWPS